MNCAGGRCAVVRRVRGAERGVDPLHAALPGGDDQGCRRRVKMMNFVLKRGICITNGELCIKNEGFCTKNDELCRRAA